MRPRLSSPLARWRGPAIAVGVALIPFLQGLSASRLFYIRDLSSYFWSRYLWLRHGWYAGEFPLWDPYAGNGQAAYSDAMHQMFHPLAVLARLIGNDVLGFNLWVLLPFPLAALGTWLFLSRRASSAAATLGAIAFAACGPTVSSGNFPNLSWSVAALPWVLWTTDRVVTSRSWRSLPPLAIAVAMQCLAGEPVTLFATLVLASSYALAIDDSGTHSLRQGVRTAFRAGLGIGLGLALSGVQLIPMLTAAAAAERAESLNNDIWSLRPTALLEMVWLHLFGDYYTVASLGEVPWMPLIYDREPLLFSIYLGVPLLALAAFGLAGDGPRRWRAFWLCAALLSLLAAFGSYTPIFAFLRQHVPPFSSFRFPVKYLGVTTMAVACAAATAVDALRAWHGAAADAAALRRRARARIVGLTVAIVSTTLVAAFALACRYRPDAIAGSLSAYAHALGETQDTASAFMIRTAPAAAGPIAAAALLTAILIGVATAARTARFAAPAIAALAILITGDLVVRASGLNPVLDASYFAPPAWLSAASADLDAGIYVGGKIEGTLKGLDEDASRGYTAAPGLNSAASRATLNVQAAYYPSAWRARETLSFDLPVMWPRIFNETVNRFFETDRAQRERFLDRTGARYRVLPQRRAGTRRALMAIPQFYESFLFDFADQFTPRATIVPDARLVPAARDQVVALFAPGWDNRRVVLLDRELPATGIAGSPAAPSARVTRQRSNHTVVEAAAGADGGYLVVLDSFADGWTATVDGIAAPIARANGLFRGVRLPAGQHRVEFFYRPQALRWGIGATVAATVVMLVLLASPRRRNATAGLDERAPHAA